MFLIANSKQQFKSRVNCLRISKLAFVKLKLIQHRNSIYLWMLPNMYNVFNLLVKNITVTNFALPPTEKYKCLMSIIFFSTYKSTFIITVISRKASTIKWQHCFRLRSPIRWATSRHLRQLSRHSDDIIGPPNAGLLRSSGPRLPPNRLPSPATISNHY